MYPHPHASQAWAVASPCIVVLVCLGLVEVGKRTLNQLGVKART